MPTFLDKNKKKTSLAALLLLLRSRKRYAALLLAVILASCLFLSPSDMLIHMPGGTRLAAGIAWIAGRLGVDVSRWGLAVGPGDFSDLLAAFRAAKEKEGAGGPGWSSFLRGREGAGAAEAGPGSLGYVKGSRKDLETAGATGELLAKNETVAGILSADDAKAIGEGDAVALVDQDVSGEREGFIKSAFAGGFANGFGGASALSGGAFAGRGFFSGVGGAAGTKLGDRVKMNAAAAAPAGSVKGELVKGGAKGRLSASRASVINGRLSSGLAGTRIVHGQRAFAQLALGRGRAAISVAPNCTAGSGCPGEFAATNTGAVYDGNGLTGPQTDILSVPNIDGLGALNVPDSGLADRYVQDAERMDADARKCRELDEKYRPQEDELSRRQEALSNEFESLGCGQGMSCGGGNKGKMQKCQQWGDQMQALCIQNQTIRCQHMRECPLTANNKCSTAECTKKKSGNDHIQQVNGCAIEVPPGQACPPEHEIHTQTVD